MLINASRAEREIWRGLAMVLTNLKDQETDVWPNSLPKQSTHQAHVVVNNLILQELMATFVYITAFKK